MSSYKIKIKGPGGQIVFEASSPLNESRNANYEGFNIVHLPTSIIAYRNTDGRKWGIQGKLVSRTPLEAQANAGYLDLARKWLLPDFGFTGATPPILKIYAFRHNNIHGRQCVLRSYGWNFPDEVDYIWQAGQAMPIIGQLSLELDEVYSASQVTGGAWRLSASGGGAFKGGGGPGISGAFWTDFGNARTTADPLSIANITMPVVPIITGIANILNQAVNNPIDLGLALVANASSSVASYNSAEVVEVTAQLPTTGNPFVSGIGPTLGPPLQAPAPSLPVSNTVVDSFARSSGLPPPSIVGG